MLSKKLTNEEAVALSHIESGSRRLSYRLCVAEE
jgi:hypothetical protein